MQSYQDLNVWKKSIELALGIYRRTDDFPQKELYGLTSQLRRAAVSVSSNIAEGKGRRTDGEYLHFLSQARGSLDELETQLHIATLLGYMREAQREELAQLAADCGRMLNGLMRSLER